MIEEPFSLPKWGEDRLAGLRRGAGVLVFWRCLAIALAFYFCILPQARAEDLFTVAGVEVDITASSAAEARKKAMAVGEARAFGLLLKRLTLKRDRARLPKLEQGEIATYLRDFQVADEKTSPVRYLAKLTFRFKARDIRSLLRDFALDFAETPSKPVLLLPVFRAVGVVSLWDDPNPWRRAWAGLDKAAGLVPLKMPFGDLTDIATIGAEQAVNGDAQRLEALARRHGVGDVIVAQAVKGATRRGLPSVRVTIRRYNQTRGDQSFEMDFPGAPGESVAGLLGRAVGAVRDGIEEMWKQDNILRFDQAMVLAVALPIRGLSDWVDAKKRLSAIAVIQGMDLVLISRDEVRINLHHIGEIEQLTLALAQADLALFEEKGGWILNFQGRAAAKRGDRSPARRTNGGA